MPYNEKLDSRINHAVADWGTKRMKMFGGTCQLLNGNMMFGVYKDFLILRLGKAAAAEAMEKPFVKPFDITGRAMKGWVMVEEEGFQGSDLDQWLKQARTFVESLPPK